MWPSSSILTDIHHRTGCLKHRDECSIFCWDTTEPASQAHIIFATANVKPGTTVISIRGSRLFVFTYWSLSDTGRPCKGPTGPLLLRASSSSRALESASSIQNSVKQFVCTMLEKSQIFLLGLVKTDQLLGNHRALAISQCYRIRRPLARRQMREQYVDIIQFSDFQVQWCQNAWKLGHVEHISLRSQRRVGK